MSEKKDEKQDQPNKAENLNFSLQDILGDDEVNTNNQSFQTIVQTFRNHDNQSASYNNLPAELQHLFSLPESNASSDIQVWNGSPHSAVSTPTSQPQPRLVAPSPSSSPAQSNNSQPTSKTQSSNSPQPSPQFNNTSAQASNASPQGSNTSSPQQSATPVIAPQIAARPLTPQQPLQTSINNTQQAPSSMTLLDNLTAQLSPVRKEKFIELFRQLQNNAVSANQFLAQARMLLDQQQYQQLENLKSKPAQPVQPQPIQPQQTNNNKNIKKPMSSSQVRAEDTQRAMSGLIAPQGKRSRATDIPINTLSPSLYRPNIPIPLQQQQQMLQQQHYLMQQQQLQPIPVEETQDFMNTLLLKEKISKTNNIFIGSDVIELLALATKERIQNLIHQMVIASKHRVESQTFTQPTTEESFKIADVQDIKKQLLAIERVEREEERKRKQNILERERKALLGEDGNEGSSGTAANGEDDKPAKKKKKKEMGPSVTARYMSDDVRNKTTNETALMIAGGVVKSWMLTGMTPSSSSSTPPPMKEKFQPMVSSPTSPTNDFDDQPRSRGRPKRRKSGSGPDIIMSGKKTKGFSGANRENGLFLPPSTIGRPSRLGEQGARKVTMRDALFVLEDEYENKRNTARKTLLKAYSTYLK